MSDGSIQEDEDEMQDIEDDEGAEDEETAAYANRESESLRREVDKQGKLVERAANLTENQSDNDYSDILRLVEEREGWVLVTNTAERSSALEMTAKYKNSHSRQALRMQLSDSGAMGGLCSTAYIIPLQKIGMKCHVGPGSGNFPLRTENQFGRSHLQNHSFHSSLAGHHFQDMDCHHERTSPTQSI